MHQSASAVAALLIDGVLLRRVDTLKMREAAESDQARIAAIKKATQDARKHAEPAECYLCNKQDLTVLDGICCPGKQHFVCDECLDGWVLSESSLAPAFTPKDSGNIWCPYKPGPKGAGCASQRPLRPQVRCHPCLLPSSAVQITMHCLHAMYEPMLA